MSSSNSPCAACKFLRRKCTQECVFAPYFPPDQPQKFANVHKVFGASNVAKILNELNAAQREDAVNSLAYEAEARLRDPVYGCVGLISILQHRLKQVQNDLYVAKNELAKYIGPSALLTMYHPANVPNSAAGVLPYNMQPMLGLPGPMQAHNGGQLVIREPQPPQQHQMLEAQQLAAVVAEREQQNQLMRSYEFQQQQQQQQIQQQQEQQQQQIQLQLQLQQQQQQEQQHHHHSDLVRFNSGFDLDDGGAVEVGGGASGTGTGGEFDQIGGGGHGHHHGVGDMSLSPGLALGTYDNTTMYHHHQIQDHEPQEQQQHQLQLQLQLQAQQLLLQQPHEPPQRDGSDDGGAPLL